MDKQHIVMGCLEALISPDNNVRSQAEAQLKSLETQPGMSSRFRVSY